MKITIVYRDFWPDTSPYAQILYKIAIGIAAAGHEVSVLTSFPSHNRTTDTKLLRLEHTKGITIKRLPLLPEYGRKIGLRLLNTIFFVIQFTFSLIFRRTDLVIVTSTPPVVDAAVVRFISYIKKFRYLYHCQDVHPEGLLLAGRLKKGLLYNLLQRVDTKNVQLSATTVVLSNDMKRTLDARNIGEQNIYIINNFIFDSQEQKSPSSKFQVTDFTILFAGNIGQFQVLDGVIAAAKCLQDKKNIHFVFLGEGIKRKELEASAGALLNKTIFFKGHRPLQEALEYMNRADLGLISIMPGVLNVAYPSKTMMYLSEGLPVLILAESDSSLARYIQKNELGYVCETMEAEKLAEIITIASLDKHTLRQKRDGIKQIAYDTFGEDIIINQWIEMLNQMEQSFSPGPMNKSC